MVPALLRLESSRLDIIRTLKLSPPPLHWSGAGVLLLLHHLLMLVSKLLHCSNAQCNVVQNRGDCCVSELVVGREEDARPGCGTRRVYAGLV